MTLRWSTDVSLPSLNCFNLFETYTIPLQPLLSSTMYIISLIPTFQHAESSQPTKFLSFSSSISKISKSHLMHHASPYFNFHSNFSLFPSSQNNYFPTIFFVLNPSSATFPLLHNFRHTKPSFFNVSALNSKPEHSNPSELLLHLCLSLTCWLLPVLLDLVKSILFPSFLSLPNPFILITNRVLLPFKLNSHHY